MKRKWAVTLGVVGLLAALVAAEFLLRGAVGTGAYLVLVNRGTADAEDVVVQAGGERYEVGPIAVGETTRVLIATRGREALKVTLSQPNAGYTVVEIPEFDAPWLRSEGLGFVLELDDRGHTRFNDEQSYGPPPRGPLGRIYTYVRGKVDDEVGPTDDQTRAGSDNFEPVRAVVKNGPPSQFQRRAAER